MQEGICIPDVFLKHIGLCIAMTLVKLPRDHDYWHGAPLRGTCRMPNFCDIMSYAMFVKIGSMLRFAMPADRDRADGGWKARV